MRFPVIVFAALLLSGCSDSDLPTQPTQTPPPVVRPGTVATYVIDAGGPCLDGGIVEVVRGQKAGESFPNAVWNMPDGRTLPCDYWDGPYIFLKNLTPGEEMTLRGSAPGYEAQEKTIVPRSGETITAGFVLVPIR